MEASGAGLAPAAAPSGDAAQQQQQQGQQQGEQQDGTTQAQPDFAQLSSQLDSLGQMLEQQRPLLDHVASEPWNQTQEQQEETPAAPDFSFLDETQPGYTPEQAAGQLQQLIDTAAETKANALVSPVQQQVQEMQVERQTDDLIARYPQLGDPKVAQEVVDTTHQWAQSIGHPELAGDPRVMEMVYSAALAKEQAGKEGADASGAATLEGAGGASPGGTQQGDSLTTKSVTDSWRTGRHPVFLGGSGAR